MTTTGARDLPDAIFRGIERGTLAYTYRGVLCCKNPVDLAILSVLLFDAKPRTIVEIGTQNGGSALWMSDQMRSYGVDCKICSVDVSPPQFDVRSNPALSDSDVDFISGNGRNLGAVFSDEFMSRCPRPLLVIEDADHYPETTGAVLEFFDRWSHVGEYIVVEDGDADHYSGTHQGGPIEAIHEFFFRRGDCYEVDKRYCDMFGLTFNMNGYIRRVR